MTGSTVNSLLNFHPWAVIFGMLGLGSKRCSCELMDLCPGALLRNPFSDIVPCLMIRMSCPGDFAAINNCSPKREELINGLVGTRDDVHFYYDPQYFSSRPANPCFPYIDSGWWMRR